MLGLILLLAIAYTCARGIENGAHEVSKNHQRRIAKSAKKNGRRTGAKFAAWTATGATATGTFLKGFQRGWKREWPKARKRAAVKFGRVMPEPQIGDDIGRDGAPAAKKPAAEKVPAAAAPKPEPAAPVTAAPAPAPPDPKPATAEARALILIKNDGGRTTTPTQTKPTTGAPMAIATIPEITGVSTLKQAVARSASESGTTAEEASAMAARAQEEMAAIEAMIEQATALEFGDDGGTLNELAAMRDMAAAALAAAQALQKAMVDKAAIAAQTSKNIHDRHSGIQEAVDTRGGRMASKQAYTADA